MTISNSRLLDPPVCHSLCWKWRAERYRWCPTELIFADLERWRCCRSTKRASFYHCYISDLLTSVSKSVTDMPRAICTAFFVVRRPRRAADTSTNRRQGFLCRRTASTEQAADTAEAAAVDQHFSSPTENISAPVCLRTPGCRLMLVLWCDLGLPVGGLLLLHPFNGLFSRTSWVSWYQKGKSSLDLNEARDDGV